MPNQAKQKGLSSIVVLVGIIVLAALIPVTKNLVDNGIIFPKASTVECSSYSHLGKLGCNNVDGCKWKENIKDCKGLGKGDCKNKESLGCSWHKKQSGTCSKFDSNEDQCKRHGCNWSPSEPCWGFEKQDCNNGCWWEKPTTKSCSYLSTNRVACESQTGCTFVSAHCIGPSYCNGLSSSLCQEMAYRGCGWSSAYCSGNYQTQAKCHGHTNSSCSGSFTLKPAYCSGKYDAGRCKADPNYQEPTPTPSCSYSTKNECTMNCWTECHKPDDCWLCPEVPVTNEPEETISCNDLPGQCVDPSQCKDTSPSQLDCDVGLVCCEQRRTDIHLPNVEPEAEKKKEKEVDGKIKKKENQSCTKTSDCANNLACVSLPGGKFCRPASDCTENSTKCSHNGEFILTCQNGHWQQTKKCSGECQGGTCPTCFPGEKKCISNILKTCDEQGYTWQEKNCEHGCDQKTLSCIPKQGLSCGDFGQDCCLEENSRSYYCNQGLVVNQEGSKCFCLNPGQNECFPGKTQCNPDSTMLKYCNSEAEWEDLQRCWYGCQEINNTAECAPPPEDNHTGGKRTQNLLMEGIEINDEVPNRRAASKMQSFADLIRPNYTCEYTCTHIGHCNLEKYKIFPDSCPINNVCCGPRENWVPETIYNQFPEHYSCIGTVAIAERAADIGFTVVYLFPESQDPRIVELWGNLCRDRGLIAMTHEDYTLTYEFPCYPNCAFWCADLLKARGVSRATVDRVSAHEEVHNIQSANDPEIAANLGEESESGQTDLQRLYQSVIEGHAEALGWEVGGTNYEKFRSTYRDLGTWAEENGHYETFESAAWGHYDDFLKIVELCNQFDNCNYQQILINNWGY